MSGLPVTLLVVAKAPEPGKAKTRLAATVGDRVAAEIAAAALLDTLDAVAAAPVTARVVALTGDLDGAACGSRDPASPRGVHGDRAARRQLRRSARERARRRGSGFGGYPVLQIGMDTPQVTVELLASCAGRLLETPAVLGLARDGGWWVLGVWTPAAADCLRTVPMSQPDTGVLTLKALRDNGIDVAPVQQLADFDVVERRRRGSRCLRTRQPVRAGHPRGRALKRASSVH